MSCADGLEWVRLGVRHFYKAKVDIGTGGVSLPLLPPA